MSATIADVATKLTALEAAQAAAMSLLDKLATDLKTALAAGVDQLAVQAIADRLDANTAALTAKTAADTPTP